MASDWYIPLQRSHWSLNCIFKKKIQKCRALGFDYFFFVPQDAEEVDYFQSYNWSPEHDNAQADLGFYVDSIV